jgi:hypothetical protein
MVALASGIPLSVAAVVNGQQSSARQANPAPGVQLPNEIYSDPLFYYHKSTFVAYLNTRFRFQTKALRWVPLWLVEVKNVGPVPDAATPGKECFSLVFRSQTRFRQNTYTLHHDALGKFNLFLVPVGPYKKGQSYEAVINRLNP